MLCMEILKPVAVVVEEETTAMVQVMADLVLSSSEFLFDRHLT